MTEIVPLRREVRPAGFVYDDETRVRCFVLFATMGARNCAATARLFANEVEGLDIRAPDARTIQLWAAEDDWNGQADNLWRNTKGRDLQELRHLASANTLLSQKAMHDILTGLDRRSVEERLITLKAIEVTMRSRERLPELAKIEPPEETTIDEDKPRDQREAEALQAMVRGKKESA